MLDFDYQLFTLINGTWHNGVLDAIVPLWRDKLFWTPLYLFLFSFLTINFKWKGLVVALCLVATMLAADGVSSHLIKKNVKRPRPCHTIELENTIRELVTCGSGYSFTSSHATNHTAIAFFLIFTLGQLFKWARLPLFLWAFSIGYGQVYVGVHYPLDILGGMLVGFLIGQLGALLCNALLVRLGWGRL